MGPGLPEATLDVLMPMHLAVSDAGVILHAGPTLAKLLPGAAGRFFDRFEIRRPGGIGDMGALLAAAGQRLHLGLRDGSPVTLRGAAMPMAGGVLINLSFGIGVLDAIRLYDLTDADFAATDLTMEVLYVVEAKTAMMDELEQLNLRLQGAKTEAEERALTDTLTGLRNRRALDEAMRRMIAADVPFGLLHMDLDYFKAVNDSFGHATGDRVLCEVARVLLAETRKGDTVARLGGDEFVILLPEQTGPSFPEGVAQRIVAQLNRPITADGHVCRISASVGVSLSARYDRPDPLRMLKDADAALYASKHAGRGRVRVA